MTPQPWLPISTAPQDGSWILLYDPSSHHKVYTGMWDRSFDHVFANGERESVEAWTGHLVRSFSFEEYEQLFPTHWMPLPQAP